MLLQIAWRNLWRNARRTVITLAALTLGVAAIVGLRSYRDSTFRQVAATITRELVGHIQVHAKGYQASPELSSVVKDPRIIEAVVAGAVPGVRLERRVLGAGLAGAGDASSGVLISGIVPGERPLTIRSGNGLGPQAGHEAIVGVELAEQLALKVDDDLILVGQAVDGSVANDRYRVVGTADAGTFELNATAVFLHIEDAQSFFGLGAGVHQLVLRLPEDASDDLGAPLSALRSALDLSALEALSWNEMLPELTGTIESKREGQKGIDFIIFLIVALGVLNAMTMATFERTRELGVMLALGTRPARIVAMILVEALLQGLMAIVIGTALVVVTFALLGDVNLGSALDGVDFAGVRLPAVLSLRISTDALGAAAFTALATVIFGGLWPAVRASRLAPIDAIGAA